MINGLISFSNIVEKLSCPELCFAFNPLIIFTVSRSINSKLKEHKIFLSNMIPYICVDAVVSSLINQGPVFAKKVLNWFAISFFI